MKKIKFRLHNPEMKNSTSEHLDNGAIDTNPKIAFGKVYTRAHALGLTGKDMAKLESLEFIKTPKSSGGVGWLTAALITIVALFVGIHFRHSLSTGDLFSVYAYFRGFQLENEPCLLDTRSDILNDVFRPITECDICTELSAVDRVSRITPEEFEDKYAYSKVPVVIVDGAQNWPATSVFSYEYFKKLYSVGSTALENAEKKCQFFPYKTNFTSLSDLFMMSDSRANMKDGAVPWYVGWSNCDPSAAAELRRHYTRPYFLPREAESSKTDWIFMGSSGYGAPLHVDNVNLPSWQAQITGQKLWTLKPPLECAYQCPSQLQVTVNPGEIIVLDTNTWYHSTKITSKDMSITIGSEFD